MASPTNRKQPRPWHTASFHKARFAMLCVGILSTITVGTISFFSSMLCVLAFLDVLAIAAWQKQKTVLPLPITTDGKQKASQKLLLGWTIIAFVFAFFGVLAITLGAFRSVGDSNKVFGWMSLAMANYAGWHLLSWLREAFAIMRQYNTVYVNEEVNFVGAPLLAQQPQALPLRVGNGANP